MLLHEATHATALVSPHYGKFGPTFEPATHCADSHIAIIDALLVGCLLHLVEAIINCQFRHVDQTTRHMSSKK